MVELGLVKEERGGRWKMFPPVSGTGFVNKKYHPDRLPVCQKTGLHNPRISVPISILQRSPSF
jgi:hypothetical protein